MDKDDEADAGTNIKIKHKQDEHGGKDQNKKTVKGESKVDKPEPMAAKLKGVPVDKGWAWVVLAGCVIYRIIFGGIIRSFGVFFLQYQQRFQANASGITVMSLIQLPVASIAGLFVMTIGLKYFSCRTAISMGGVLHASAFMITAFAEDVRVFYVAFGIFGGSGVAMVLSPITAMIGIYFNKHRGLANSIYLGAGAIGGLTFAPVVTTLFEKYGFTGAMMIFSALLLHSQVVAALMRPPSWWVKAECVKTSKNLDEAEECLIEKSGDEIKKSDCMIKTKIGDQLQRPWKLPFKVATLSKSMDEINRLKEKGSSSVPVSNLFNRNGTKSTSQIYINLKAERDLDELEKLNSVVSASGEGHFGSLVAVNTPELKEDLSKTAISNTEMRPTEKSSCISGVKKNFYMVLTTIFDRDLLRNVVFIHLSIMGFLASSGMTLIPTFIPTYASERGVPYSKIAIILSVNAGVDLTAKLISGYIADRKWLRRTTILGFAALATGTMCHMSRLFTTFTLILTMTIIISCFYNLYGPMLPTILIDCVGLAKFKSSLGLLSLIQGGSLALFYPVCGLLRDTYGSYIFTFHLCGCLCYMGGVLLLLLPYTKERVQAKKCNIENKKGSA